LGVESYRSQQTSLMIKTQNIEIVDVTARDGLQNESVIFTTEDKIDLINRSIETGVKRLEVASFVHPKYVPQMADAEAVINNLPEKDNLTYIGLAMNERGVDRALKTKIDEIGLVVVATDTFAKKNQNQTRDSSIKMASSMVKKIKSEGRKVNVTIAASFGCPFEGEVEIGTVVEMAQQIAFSNPDEISIADTIGVGDPWKVKELFSQLKSELPTVPLRAHFHNTRNTGLANVYTAIECGVNSIDVSIGGIGGCPFAPSATGNVPSEDVVYMLGRNGIDTGLSLNKLISTSQWLSKKMGKTLPGMVSRAGSFPENLSRAI